MTDMEMPTNCLQRAGVYSSPCGRSGRDLELPRHTTSSTKSRASTAPFRARLCVSTSGADAPGQRHPQSPPPLEEQHEIVRRVDALFQLADAIEKRVAAATKCAGKLTQSILAKAFRGELVPTEAELARREGRSYEPASALLKRIQTDCARQQERNKSTKPRKRRPTT